MIVISCGESSTMINTRKLVYGHAELHDCLAFADGETAGEEAREIVAIASARTWGEARGIEPRHVWNPVPEIEDDPDEHDDAASFDINQVGRVIEGDWPPMVTSRAFDLLPSELLARFGHRMDTSLNGDFVEIPVAAEADLVAALRERRYTVTRDDELINTLDGQTFR
jgi:hypothetical protein